MTATDLYNLIINFREQNQGRYPDHGFINIEDYHSLFNDRNIFDYSRGSMDFREESEDFNFAGVPFYICNNVNAPLTLVSK